jgi:methylglutaconyl-CoA hydratase
MELRHAGRIHVPETLGAAGIDRLRGELRAAVASTAVRVVVLHGNEQTFCLGADWADVLNATGATTTAEAFADLLTELLHSAKPIIAEVRGQAVAGGVGLAAAADLVVAADGATFALTEALFGVVPAIVAPVLLRRMTQARVTLWTISAEPWAAVAAQAAGLVDLTVPEHALEATTAAWVKRLQRTDPEAVGVFKRRLTTATANPVDGVATTIERFSDPAVLQRIRAFVENGEAPWLRPK